jgi:hypothetical protein
MAEPIDPNAAYDVMAKLLAKKQHEPQLPLLSPQETQHLVSFLRSEPDYVDEKTLHIFLQKIAKATKPQNQTLTWEQTREVIKKILKEALKEAHKDETMIGSPADILDVRVRVSNVARQSGMYVLGVQGTGKSSYLEGLILQDLWDGFPVIVIDPHGDVVDHVIGMIPNERMKDTYLLDMADEVYPFGVNIFSGKAHQTTIEQTQAVDRVMHIFEVLWGDVLSQQNLPRYLRAASITLLSNPGATLVDMYDFLLNDQTRQSMLKNVTDPTVRQFWELQYNDLSESARSRRVEPLVNRLEALFMGRSLVRNIVGQAQTSINFRRAIENNEIILIKLPIKTLPQDARLIGTILIAQIYAAVFSFADLPLHKRPGFSLFVDEFQHFVTMDFGEMFTEGRKFGSRLTLAHQLRGQLRGEVGDIVKAATKSAYTKIVFRTTDDDAHDIAEHFISTQTTVRKEDIEPHPVRHLLTYGHKDATVTRFIDQYLRPVSLLPKRFEIAHWEESYGMAEFSTGVVLSAFGLFLKPQERPVVDNPLPYLEPLLYDVQVSQDPTLEIPFEVLLGFSDCGVGYYQVLDKSSVEAIEELLMLIPWEEQETKPQNRRLQGKREQGIKALEFITLLRFTMRTLATDPLGQKHTESKAEVVQRIIQLPNRQALAKIGTVVHHIRTLDLPANPFNLPPSGLMKRQSVIKDQTRARYCTPKHQVEQEIAQRHKSTGGVFSSERPGATERRAEPTEDEQRVSRWQET